MSTSSLHLLPAWLPRPVLASPPLLTLLSCLPSGRPSTSGPSLCRSPFSSPGFQAHILHLCPGQPSWLSLLTATFSLGSRSPWDDSKTPPPGLKSPLTPDLLLLLISSVLPLILSLTQTVRCLRQWALTLHPFLLSTIPHTEVALNSNDNSNSECWGRTESFKPSPQMENWSVGEIHF